MSFIFKNPKEKEINNPSKNKIKIYIA